MAKNNSNKADKKKEKSGIVGVYLSHTPCHFTYEGKDYSLFYKEQYELPDSEFIRSLIGQGKIKTIEKTG